VPGWLDAATSYLGVDEFARWLRNSF